MAVKIFCNQCTNFIREARQAEFSKLTGEEICQTCRERNLKTFSEVEKARDAAIAHIKRVASEHLVKLDEAMRRVVSE